MSVLSDKISNLPRGKSFVINFDNDLNEATEGGNLLEHYTMYHLATLIEQSDISFNGNSNTFLTNKKFIDLKKKHVPEIDARMNSYGRSQATKIFKDIISNKENQLDLEVEIIHQDVRKEGSADITLRFHKLSTREMMDEIRISLKKSENPGGTPMGMKVLLSFLTKIANDISEKIDASSNTDTDILSRFIKSDHIKQQLKFVRDAKLANGFFSDRNIPNSERVNYDLFQDFINSDFYKNDTSLAKRNYDKKDVFYNDRSQRATRSSAWQSYLKTKFDMNKLMAAYADIFNHIVEQYIDNPNTLEVIKEKIKFFIGFDDVEIYKATPQGDLVDIKRFNETKGYQDIMNIIQRSTKILFRKDPKLRKVYVEIYVLNDLLGRFSFGMNYLGGEIQVGVDYRDLEQGKTFL
jgi:hypothetical protein